MRPNDCESGATVRLWTLTPRTDGSAALRNEGPCDVELQQLSLLFDEEDANATDCAVTLPNALLGPGESLRVGESVLPIDIDLGQLVSDACPTLSSHPNRGSRVYLCRGRCQSGTVVDLLAHQGTFDADPPEQRFGTTFREPTQAFPRANARDFYRYQRVHDDGTPPNFLGSDWVLGRRALFADFENGLSAVADDGTTVTHSTIDSESSEVVSIDEAAYFGVAGLRITHRGENAMSTALSYPLTASPNPSEITYFAQTDLNGGSTAHLELVSEGERVIEVTFGEAGLGADLLDGGRAEVSYAAGTWYQVDLRDIDWEAATFDLYVDRVPVGVDLSFLTPATSADELRVYSVTGASTVYFDALELWQ